MLIMRLEALRALRVLMFMRADWIGWLSVIVDEKAKPAHHSSEACENPDHVCSHNHLLRLI